MENTEKNDRDSFFNELFKTSTNKFPESVQIFMVVTPDDLLQARTFGIKDASVSVILRQMATALEEQPGGVGTDG